MGGSAKRDQKKGGSRRAALASAELPHGTSEREDAEPSGEQLSLSALCAAAASAQGLFGERAGKPLLRVVDPKRARSGERVGESHGINVHADVVVPARDRARLERLCRYVCRPPLAQNRRSAL